MVFLPFYMGCAWEYQQLQKRMAKEVKPANKASKPFKQLCAPYLKALLQHLFLGGMGAG